MNWPEIFFKARKTSAVPELPPTIKQPPEDARPAASEAELPAIKPPVPLAPVPGAVTNTPPAPPSSVEPAKIPPIRTETSTRTLPAMHGVVLRPPTPKAQSPLPPVSKPSVASSAAPVSSLPVPAPVDPMTLPSSTLRTEVASSEIKKAEPAFAAPSVLSTSSAPSLSSRENESLVGGLEKEAEATSASQTPAVAPLLPFGIFRRKAKMTELARIVLPPKREENEPVPTPPESSPTVVPPAFPVAAMTARPGKTTDENPDIPKATTAPVVEISSGDKPAEVKPAGMNVFSEPALKSPADDQPELSSPRVSSSVNVGAPTPNNFPIGEASNTPPPFSGAAPDSISPGPPRVDSQAHQPEPSSTPLPKVDPEAHKPEPPPASTQRELAPSPRVQEKREFHLANGERIAGVVLSETPEAIYVDHSTLGVVTIPRAEIAKRLVEIILINGDRIVGDIMAETVDNLYVRHASLGMLTVPRAQRSTRVVEAILKDGDRILGEVLTETDAFTVIRSATLGTVTVAHDKISMLNRKIEQIELKSLPPAPPELKDKSS